LALIASSLRSTSKKPVCPMTRSPHPPMAHCGQRVRFAATWREEFFEVPPSDSRVAGPDDMNGPVPQEIRPIEFTRGETSMMAANDLAVRRALEGAAPNSPIRTPVVSTCTSTSRQHAPPGSMRTTSPHQWTWITIENKWWSEPSERISPKKGHLGVSNDSGFGCRTRLVHFACNYWGIGPDFRHSFFIAMALPATFLAKSRIGSA
jgi:hypothetical protein